MGRADQRRANCAPSPTWPRSTTSPPSRSPAASASTCLGVKKEDLPAVWADLNAAGMVSGHAYGKALRTVKTCVGSEWCRFGTQDSTGLGVKLEKMCWGSWTPHKVKIAVSGCPRNCAEATIKDFGVVCVERGYDLLVGGNGGIDVRVTDLWCRSRPRRRCWNMPAPSCSSIARRRIIWSAPRPGSSASASPMSNALVEDAAGREAAHARFLHSQTIRADRSMGGTRCRTRERRRVQARTRASGGRRMSGFLKVMSLTEIPRLGSRVVRKGDINIALFRTEDDRVFAVTGQVPAQGRAVEPGPRARVQGDLPVAWNGDRARVRKGRRARRGLRPHLPTKVEDGAIWIDLSAPAVAAA